MNTTDSDALHAVEAIRQLKARYFRCLDQQDWDGYRDVFTVDVVIDTTDDPGVAEAVHGRDAFVDMLAPMLAGAITVHHGHMPEIELTGPDTAQGVWAMEDRIWFPDHTGLGHLWGTGWYVEEYRCEGGTWRISAMTLRRQRLELGGHVLFPPAATPPSPA